MRPGAENRFPKRAGSVSAHGLQNADKSKNEKAKNRQRFLKKNLAIADGGSVNSRFDVIAALQLGPTGDDRSRGFDGNDAGRLRTLFRHLFALAGYENFSTVVDTSR
jgi:hypothetical protein